MNKHQFSIELFYFDHCPSWKVALKNLEQVLSEMGIDQQITLVQVKTSDDAIKNKFTGSPTIKLNGEDLFPLDHKNYALGCRIYMTPQGYQGSPTKEMITEKLKSFIY